MNQLPDKYSSTNEEYKTFQNYFKEKVPLYSRLPKEDFEYFYLEFCCMRGVCLVVNDENLARFAKYQESKNTEDAAWFRTLHNG